MDVISGAFRGIKEHLHLDKGKNDIGKFTIFILVAISLVAQIAYIINYISGYRPAATELQPGTVIDAPEIASKRASAFLTDVESWSDIILAPVIREYVTGFMNLVDAESYEQHRKRVEEYLNLIEPPPHLVSKFYLLGSDKNHKSFMKITGQADLSEDVPDVDVLRRLKFWDKLNSYPNSLLYIPAGSLRREMFKNIDKFSEYTEINDFISQVENNLIIYKSVSVSARRAYLVCIVNPEFYTHYFDLFEGEQNFGIEIYDGANNRLWSNEELDKDKHNDKKEREKNGRLLRLQNYKIMFYQQEQTSFNYTTGDFLLHFMIALISCLFTGVVGKILFGRIMKAYDNLSKRFKEQSLVTAFDFRKIDHHSRHFFDNISLRGRIFAIFLVSVLIPQLAAGFVYSLVLYSRLKDNTYDDLLLTSQQINFNLENNFELCSLYAMNIDVNNVRRYITAARNPYMPMTTVRAEMEVTFATQTPQTYLLDQIVILAPDGSSLYQSAYPELYFNVNTTTIQDNYESSGRDVFFLYNVKDILGNPSNAVVRKIRNDNNQLMGYLQIYLKNEVFTLSKENYHFGLIVANSELIYSDSNYDIDYGMFSGEQTEGIFRLNHKGTSLLAAFKRGSRLACVVVQNEDYLFYKSQMLLIGNTAMMLVMLLVTVFASWRISQIIARPVLQMINRIVNCENGNFELMPEHGRNDEIGRLIHTYNNLISKINVLMDENAKHRLKEIELSRLKTEAELDMLQQQINPHFLYNTLELISMDATNGSKASKMAQLLSKLFRYACSASGFVTLGEEVMHTQNYIAIQKLRFPEKFHADWIISDSARDCVVFKFILQPIIENCITHGINEYVTGGEIKVVAKTADDNLIIEVSDNGTGMNKDELRKLNEKLVGSSAKDKEEQLKEGRPRHGVGLKNVYDRVMLKYGDKAVFQVESKFMGGTKITIITPIK